MMGRGMSAVQEAVRYRQQGLQRLARWSPRGAAVGGRPPERASRWPLLRMPAPFVAYVLTVLACDLGLIGWQLAVTPLQAADVILFAALLGAAVICIEAMRRLGQPSGMSRDLLSAWWLPIALLLPPLYAMLAPLVIGAVLFLRVRPTPIYRRAFNSAALGLAGAAASATFHLTVPGAVRVSLAGPDAWLTRPAVVLTAVGCAVMFAVLSTGVQAVAAHLAEPGAPLVATIRDRESLLLDLTETCVGILVAITCALSFLLLLVALPPVILLQRCLMHQQLAAAARTDPKTGLLNATAWQREADAEVSRAQRSGVPLALLLVDVDHFKRVNDRHGHLIGDQVLRALAAELRQQVRESDVVGRFGGEEFTVLLPRTDATGGLPDRRTAAHQRQPAAGLRGGGQDQGHRLDRGGRARPARRRPV